MTHIAIISVLFYLAFALCLDFSEEIASLFARLISRFFNQSQ